MAKQSGTVAPTTASTTATDIATIVNSLTTGKAQLSEHKASALRSQCEVVDDAVTAIAKHIPSYRDAWIASAPKGTTRTAAKYGLSNFVDSVNAAAKDNAVKPFADAFADDSARWIFDLARYGHGADSLNSYYRKSAAEGVDASITGYVPFLRDWWVTKLVTRDGAYTAEGQTAANKLKRTRNAEKSNRELATATAGVNLDPQWKLPETTVASAADSTEAAVKLRTMIHNLERQLRVLYKADAKLEPKADVAFRAVLKAARPS